jgi:hypothetical protein
VVPGYVKCPKCHTALPRTKTVAKGAGGTAVPATATVPWVPIAITVAVAGGIILFFALRKGNSAKAEPPPGPAPTVPLGPTAPTPAPTPLDVPSPTLTPQPTGPSRNDVARDLRRGLEQRRLWSTVTVTGSNVEVRGTSCTDKQMAPTIDAIAAAAKAAGLTRLRCVEQSGAVVFTRDF